MLHKDRIPTLFLGKGTLSVEEGTLCFLSADPDSRRACIPVAQFSCIFLGPGASVTHAAIKLCADEGCLVHWVGEDGVRFYSAGVSKVARTDRLWVQAEKALNRSKRLSVARKMYAYRYGSDSGLYSYTLEQLSGLEAAKVKRIYRELAEANGLLWQGRSFLEVGSAMKDRVNLCVSVANSCLYGISHAAIVAAGYSPAMGFIHGRTAQAFVYDLADLVKFRDVTPIAFRVAADSSITDPSRETRMRCRELFSSRGMVDLLIAAADEVVGFNRESVEGPVERPAILPPFDFHHPLPIRGPGDDYSP
jgi:CRISPR-associated protein Cas1